MIGKQASPVRVDRKATSNYGSAVLYMTLRNVQRETLRRFCVAPLFLLLSLGYVAEPPLLFFAP